MTQRPSTYRDNAPRCATCRHVRMVWITGQAGHGFVCGVLGAPEDQEVISQERYKEGGINPSGVCDFHEPQENTS